MNSYAKGLVAGIPIGIVLFFVVVLVLRWAGTLDVMTDW
ncbi:nitrogen fixation-related uncharacterized protein [Roseospira visakhapatnamensis]|uniref:Nitrogen fixation-related uncharacterized protein n=1 Tax=Roseospira visakhapatnamensis TaxID=390880 RepID=A0A7W6RAT8_9PROT|nr:nitrogen fixation-related uncharacterized protein [Roseospira visakhapatnamensis]